MQTIVHEQAAFNWILFLILVIICIPGILSLIPTLKLTYHSLLPKWPEGKKIPSEKQFIIGSTLNSFILVFIAAAFGTAFAHRVNLHAPLLENLINHQNPWIELRSAFLPTLFVTLIGVIVFLFGYYVIARPRLDTQTVEAMEKLRMAGGIWTRILYGGVVEEVLMRWGLMTLFVWIGGFVFGILNPFIYWSAILISGILFGLGHLPAYLTFGCRKTPIFIATAILLNLWAALIFGWLFWQYGLIAAILSHIIFHLVWYPFDRVILKN